MALIAQIIVQRGGNAGGQGSGQQVAGSRIVGVRGNITVYVSIRRGKIIRLVIRNVGGLLLHRSRGDQLAFSVIGIT